jgi:hypothetical protein
MAKIRLSFVANSSSSSFVLYGISAQKYQNDLIEACYQKELKNNPELDRGDFEMYFYLSEAIDDKIVSIEGQSDYEYIGVSPESLRENFPDATFKETFSIAAKEISRVLGVEVTQSEIGYHEDGWYDG